MDPDVIAKKARAVLGGIQRRKSGMKRRMEELKRTNQQREEGEAPVAFGLAAASAEEPPVARRRRVRDIEEVGAEEKKRSSSSSSDRRRPSSAVVTEAGEMVDGSAAIPEAAPKPAATWKSGDRTRSRNLLGNLLVGTLRKAQQDSSRGSEVEKRRAEVEKRLREREEEERKKMQEKRMEDREALLEDIEKRLAETEEKEDKMEKAVKEYEAALREAHCSHFLSSSTMPVILFLPAVLTADQQKQLQDKRARAQEGLRAAEKSLLEAGFDVNGPPPASTEEGVTAEEGEMRSARPSRRRSPPATALPSWRGAEGPRKRRKQHALESYVVAPDLLENARIAKGKGKGKGKGKDEVKDKDSRKEHRAHKSRAPSNEPAAATPTSTEDQPGEVGEKKEVVDMADLLGQ